MTPFPHGKLHGFAERAVLAGLCVGFWWVMLAMWCSPALRRHVGVKP